MSYFSNALGAFLEHTSQGDLAAASGFSQATISLYRSGERHPSRVNIDELIAGIATLADRWEITKAYILDSTPREFINQIREKLDSIEFPPDLLQEPNGAYHVDKDLDSTLNLLKFLAEGDSFFKEMLTQWARRW